MSSLATFWLLDVLSPPLCGLDASRQPQLRAGLQGSIFFNAGSGVLSLHRFSSPSTPRTLVSLPKSEEPSPSSKAFRYHHLESESDFGLRGMCEL